jgi:hypothetical protein
LTLLGHRRDSLYLCKDLRKFPDLLFFGTLISFTETKKKRLTIEYSFLIFIKTYDFGEIYDFGETYDFGEM